jgi:II/X family phage/plasmid replication protein
VIDWSTVIVPCTHPYLETGAVMSINAAGDIEWSARKRLPILGSHDSRITVRSEGAAGPGQASHLVISGNPSKFLQGHNIFGSDDLVALVYDTFTTIYRSLDLNPLLSEIRQVRAGDYRMSRLDINYMFDLPRREDVPAWLRAAEYKSKTRHGRPTSKGSTLYWGKGSKRWEMLAYDKFEEVKRPKHRLPEALRDTPLISWIENKLRIELRLKSKQLDELGLSLAKNWTPRTVMKTYFDYLGRLDMTENIALSTDALMDLPQRLRSTYNLWKDGHDLRFNMSRNTFYKHRRELLEYGINIDIRQDRRDTSNVVPLVRVLEAKPAAIPSWAFDLDLVHPSARAAS